MDLIKSLDDERLEGNHYIDPSEYWKVMTDSLRDALGKISELEETLYSDEDVANIKRAEDVAHKLYAKMKVERDAALSREAELQRQLCGAREIIAWGISFVEKVGKDWHKAGDMMKFNASEYIAAELRRRSGEEVG